MAEEREQQILSVIEEGWARWFTGYGGSMDVMAARLAYEAGWRQQEASFRVLMVDQDRAIDALAAAREENLRLEVLAGHERQRATNYQNEALAAREENGRLREALEELVRRGSDFRREAYGEGQIAVGADIMLRAALKDAEAALTREDEEATTERADEVSRLRGLLLRAGTVLLAAMHGQPVDDSVLNDIEAALPQGLTTEEGS